MSNNNSSTNKFNTSLPERTLSHNLVTPQYIEIDDNVEIHDSAAVRTQSVNLPSYNDITNKINGNSYNDNKVIQTQTQSKFQPDLYTPENLEKIIKKDNLNNSQLNYYDKRERETIESFISSTPNQRSNSLFTKEMILKPNEINNTNTSESTEVRESLGIENSLNMTKKNSSIKETTIKIDIYDKFKDAIECINYIETEYNFNSLTDKETVFALKIYKTSTKQKYIVIDFEKKKTLSTTRIFKNNTIVTSTTVYKDLLFVGNSQGLIRMYSIDKEYDYKGFTTKEVESLTNIKDVLSMDVSKDGEYLISGYQNGYLSLWDITSGKCKKIVTSLFKSGIIAVKFIKNDKRKFEMLVSELSGLLHYVTLREGTFTFHQDARQLMESETPFYSLEILAFQEEEMDRPHFEEFYNSTIVAIACIDFICVLMLEPAEVLIFQFNRPKYFKDFFTPDISFGVGFIPYNEKEETDMNSCFNESINRRNSSNNDLIVDSFIDYLKPQCLFTISWGNYIYIYSMNSYSNNETNSMKIFFTQVGHYVNNTSINRMSMIANSIIFLFDKENKLKVLNTSLVTPGGIIFDTSFEKWEAFIDKRYIPELEEGNIIDKELNFHTYIKDNNKKSLPTYNHHILNINKCIYLCAKNSFYQGKLLNWEQSLTLLTQKADWMDALTLGLDIYHGRTLGLADIPQEEGMRRALLGKFLMKTIQHYVAINLGGDDNIILISDKSIKEKIGKCISITVEFCIDMGSIDFLMGIIMPLFEKKGYSHMFIQKLQPFILCGTLESEKLSFRTVKKIIETYVQNKRFLELSQILVHLGIHNLDNDEITNDCDKFNLITPIIYIYTNSDQKEDYFYPIIKMFEVYKTANEIKNFTDFRIHYRNITNEVVISKQFIGHKLLWYINMCLKGFKFPNGLIPDKIYNKLVVQILFWLVKTEIFNDLLRFASVSLFKIFKKFIKKERIKEILSNEKLDFGSSNVLPDLKPSTILEFVIQKSKDFGDPKTLLNMYELVLKCGGIKEISKNQLIEAGRYILKSNSNNEIIHDDSYTINMDKINKINDMIINMIDSRDDFEMSDYTNLLNQAELSPFVVVKIHLLKKVKNYTRCLHEFFENNLYLQDKDSALFEWIDSTLKELSETDLYNFELLKEEVLNKLTNLSEISIESVTLLVENWFKNDQSKVLSKLHNVKPLQLKYVENVLEKNKDMIESYMTHDNYDNQFEEKYKQYSELLKLHIKLLCKVNPGKILYNLKKRPYYPVDECLKMCQKYKANEGTIYLLQQIGAIKDAINLSISIMNEHFNSFLNNATSEHFNENLHKLSCENFNYDLNQSINICEQNSDKIHQGGAEEEYWFIVLEELYFLNHKLKEQITEEKKQLFLDFMDRISLNIRELLEKMCSYVSIQAIINNVTEKYKSAEFKEFKQILHNMLTSYGHLRNILNSAKNLLSNSVLYQIVELKKLNNEGSSIFLYKCDLCHNLFDHEYDESIYVYGCGHKFHIQCAHDKDNHYVCQICKKNELEDNVTNPNMVTRASLIEKDTSKFKDNQIPPIIYPLPIQKTTWNKKLLVEVDKHNKLPKSPRSKLISKLKTYDKEYLERDSLVFISQ